MSQKCENILEDPTWLLAVYLQKRLNFAFRTCVIHYQLASLMPILHLTLLFLPFKCLSSSTLRDTLTVNHLLIFVEVGNKIWYFI